MTRGHAAEAMSPAGSTAPGGGAGRVPAPGPGPRPPRRAAVLVGALLAFGLVTACGAEDGAASASRSSETAPSAAATAPGTTEPPGAESTPRDEGGAGSTSPGTKPSRDGAGSPVASTRCHTSELRASVGRDDPGAGQRNFPVVLTNASAHTCTLRGYPGAAFVDTAGEQLGPDPRRTAGSPRTLSLAPGRSAWAGLSFSSPEITEARTATPAALLVTPPDERDPLRVAWTAGEVPVGGNASSVVLTVLEPGTGP
ncbi:DUF4232 domain-containing protein [Streptomyces sp. SID8352]|uniref:DUF4232 domain-containing protein n=1 Tax=Streptomyces sp. SID8352 TaxID=2690338 RepID=UPI0031F6CFB0